MGTRNNPGKFLCEARAEPDEPTFLLLGRDRHGAEVVRYWAYLRLGGASLSKQIDQFLRNEPNTNEKYANAIDVANEMDVWFNKLPPFKMGDKAQLAGDVNPGVVTSVVKSDIAQSGYLVEINGDGQGIGATGLRSGLIDSGQFKRVPA
jgi:hypothetical protein